MACMDNVGFFHKSSYWYTWSRMWVLDNPKWGCVYLNLTPVNGFRGYNDKDVKEELFRGIVCGPTDKDIIQSTLPTQVRQEMEKAIGVELTQRLMTFDYMSIITPEEIDVACRKSNGGGVPLAFILSLRTNPDQFHTNT